MKHTWYIICLIQSKRSVNCNRLFFFVFFRFMTWTPQFSIKEFPLETSYFVFNLNLICLINIHIYLQKKEMSLLWKPTGTQNRRERKGMNWWLDGQYVEGAELPGGQKEAGKLHIQSFHYLMRNWFFQVARDIKLFNWSLGFKMGPGVSRKRMLCRGKSWTDIPRKLQSAWWWPHGRGCVTDMFILPHSANIYWVPTIC